MRGASKPNERATSEDNCSASESCLVGARFHTILVPSAYSRSRVSPIAPPANASSVLMSPPSIVLAMSATWLRLRRPWRRLFDRRVDGEAGDGVEADVAPLISVALADWGLAHAPSAQAFFALKRGEDRDSIAKKLL